MEPSNHIQAYGDKDGIEWERIVIRLRRLADQFERGEIRFADLSADAFLDELPSSNGVDAEFKCSPHRTLILLYSLREPKK